MQNSKLLIHVDFCDLFFWNDFVIKLTQADSIDTPTYYIDHADGVVQLTVPASYKQGKGLFTLTTLFLENNQNELRLSYSKFLDGLSDEELKHLFKQQKISAPYIFNAALKRLDPEEFLVVFFSSLVALYQNLGSQNGFSKYPLMKVVIEQLLQVYKNNLSLFQNNIDKFVALMKTTLDETGDASDMVTSLNELIDEMRDEATDMASLIPMLTVSTVKIGSESVQKRPSVLNNVDSLEELIKQDSQVAECTYQQAQALIPLADVKQYHGAEQVLRQHIKKRLIDCGKDTLNKLDFLDLPALRALNVAVGSHPKITEEFFNIALEATAVVSEFLCGTIERRLLSQFIDKYKESLEDVKSQSQAAVEYQLVVECNGFFDAAIDLVGKLKNYRNTEDNIYYSAHDSDQDQSEPESPFTVLLNNIFCCDVFQTDIKRYFDISSDESVTANLKYLLDCGHDHCTGFMSQNWGSLSKSLTQVDQSIIKLSNDCLKLSSHNATSIAKMISQVMYGEKDAFAAASAKSLTEQLSEAHKIVNSFDSLRFFANIKNGNSVSATVLDYHKMSVTVQNLFAAIFNLLFSPTDEAVKDTNEAIKSDFLWQNLAPTQEEAKLLQQRLLANHQDGTSFLDLHLPQLLQQEVDLKLMLRSLSIFTYLYNPLFQKRLMLVANVIDVEAFVLYMNFTFNLIYTSLLSLITNSRIAAAILPYTAENKQRFPNLDRILKYGELALSLLNTLVHKPLLQNFYFMSLPKDTPNRDLFFMGKAYQYSSDVLCWMRNALVLGKTNKAEDALAQKLWTERFQPLLTKNLGQVTDYLLEVNLTYLMSRNAPHDMSCFYKTLHGELAHVDAGDVCLSYDNPCLSVPLQVISHAPSEMIFADYLVHGASVAKFSTKIDPESRALQIDDLSFKAFECKSLYAKAELVFNPSSKQMLVLMQPDWFAKFQVYIEHAQGSDSQLSQEDLGFANELFEELKSQAKCRLACFRELHQAGAKGTELTSCEYAEDMRSVTCKGTTFNVFYDAQISIPAVVKVSSHRMICLLPRAAMGAQVYREIDNMLANAIKLKDQTTNGVKQFEDCLMYFCNLRWNFWDRNWRGLMVLDDGRISFRDLTYEVRDSGSLLSAVLRLDNNIEGLQPVIYMPKFLQSDPDIMRSLGSILTLHYGNSICMLLKNMRDNIRKDVIRMGGYVKTFKGNVSKYEQIFGASEPERCSFLDNIVCMLDSDMEYMKNWGNMFGNYCQELLKYFDNKASSDETFPLVEASYRYKLQRYEYDRFYKAFEQALAKIEHLKQAIKSELPKKTGGPRAKKVTAESED